MPKNNNFINILLGALAIVAAVDLYFTASYNLTYLKLHRAQPTFQLANNMRGQMNALLQMLGGDLLEYSKKNPSIDPLLLSYGFKQSGTNAPQPKPIKP
jgi:hypothetical protein